MSEVLVQKVALLTQEERNKVSVTATTEFSRETNKIILPEGMSKKDAATELMNQHNAEEQEQDFTVTFEDWEWRDSLRAIKNVIEQEFGWVQGRETMFSSPTEINIITNVVNGSKISETAFAGPLTFAAWDKAPGAIGVRADGKAWIKLKAKKKWSILINEFFNAVRNYLATQSIYRGKAVIVESEGGAVAGVSAGEMKLEITEIKHNPAIFLEKDKQLVIENFIIDQLNDKGKRTFLFPGFYGNGKTETAINIGVEALKRGLSFFYVKHANQFTKILKLAKNYEPCVIFLEDVDEITQGTNRTADINEILNTLDGVDTKGRDIITIFTTNNKKLITAPLRRPGRIDLILEFDNPSKDVTERITRYYFQGLTGGNDVDYQEVLEKMPEASGATIAEICKRAVKLARKKGVINTGIITSSIASMLPQVDFMKDAVEIKDPVREAFETIREFNDFDPDEGTYRANFK